MELDFNREYLTEEERQKPTTDVLLRSLIDIDDDIAKYQALRSGITGKLAKLQKKEIDLEQKLQVIDDRMKYLRSIKTTIRMLLANE